jgi:D-amino peptidase
MKRFLSGSAGKMLKLMLPVMFTAFSTLSAQVKIYIETDLEGVSGVYKFAQTREKDSPLNIKACEYFMGDLAEVIRGLRDGGATEIVVIDAHGNRALIPDMMIPGAKYVTGLSMPDYWKADDASWGLNRTYAGIVLFGFHSMMGTPDGVLNHSRNSKAENRYWYNGVESGELAQTALVAGYYDVPPILVTGDVAACREARKFFGPDIVTVVTKEGISREAAVLYPFEETHKALYEGAKKAIAAIPKCKPYKVDLPIKARMEYLDLKSGASEPKRITKEWIIPDAIQLLDTR